MSAEVQASAQSPTFDNASAHAEARQGSLRGSSSANAGTNSIGANTISRFTIHDVVFSGVTNNGTLTTRGNFSFHGLLFASGFSPAADQSTTNIHVQVTDGARQGLETIRYQKRENGHTFIVEEVRTGRKKLALKTMWKVSTGALDAGKPSLEASGSPTASLTPEALPGHSTSNIDQSARTVNQNPQESAAPTNDLSATAQESIADLASLKRADLIALAKTEGKSGGYDLTRIQREDRGSATHTKMRRAMRA